MARPRKKYKDYLQQMKRFEEAVDNLFTPKNLKKLSIFNQPSWEKSGKYNTNFDEEVINRLRSSFINRFTEKHDPKTNRLTTKNTYTLQKRGFKTIEKLMNEQWLNTRSNKQILRSLFGNELTNELKKELEEYELDLNDTSLGKQIKIFMDRGLEWNSDNPVVNVLLDVRAYAKEELIKATATGKRSIDKWRRRYEESNEALREGYYGWKESGKNTIDRDIINWALKKKK